MSAIHVLEGDGQTYEVVVHFAVPAGSNSGGLTWKAAALAAGFTGTTVLPTGTGPAQIDTTERTQVIAGDVGEIVVRILTESGGTSAPQRQASVQAQVNQAIVDTLADWQRRLRYYGLEIA